MRRRTPSTLTPPAGTIRRPAVTMALLLAVALLAGPATAGVEARREQVAIPTFEMGPPEPSPAVFATSDWYNCYPRAAFRTYTRSPDPVDRDYTMAVLENEYLRVEVLPDVGGRIWRIVDRRTGENLLWTNDAVKPIRVGRRRGWVAGGVELAFPVGNHGADTIDPWRWEIREEADGGRTVVVSTFDHFYRFHSTYEITLRPGEARIELRVRLYNPTPVRNRYQYWINAAVDAREDLQFIMPVDYVTGHGFSGIYKWPEMEGEEDLSYWKNVEHSLGVFGWDADILGVYFHENGRGLIRFSPKEFTRGLKLWTWGTRSHWTGEYSINKGSYCEVQGGRWATQTMYRWLEPHAMDTWTEYWYPVKDLDGVDAASKDAAISVTFSQASGGEGAATVRLNALRPISATLRVEAGGQTLLEKGVKADPGRTVVAEAPLEGISQDEPVEVTLVDGEGFRLVHHVAAREKKRGPEPELPDPIEVEAEGRAGELLKSGLRAELEEADPAAAEKAYRQALEEDAGLARAWKALGVLQLKQLDCEGARASLSKALELEPGNPEAKYYLGLAELRAGREGALETLRAVDGDVTFTHAARFLLARETLADGSYEEAVEAFREAGRGWSADPLLHGYLALAARLAGDRERAGEALRAALLADPADPFAKVEALFSSGTADENSITAALGVDEDLYIEVALCYDAAGRHGEALSVAQASEEFAGSGLYYYYLAWFAGKSGKEDLARTYAEKALEMGTDYVFPHRHEAAEAFSYVESLTGNPGQPRYNVAVMLYWLGREQEATDTWESLADTYDVPGLFRNLGISYSEGRMVEAREKAVLYFEKALEEDPEQAEIYYELDELYQYSWGERETRRRLLEKGREVFPENDYIVLRQALYLCDRDRYENAARLLETYEFHRSHQSRELEHLGRSAITRTYTGLALEALEDDRNDEALGHLKTAAGAEDMLHTWFD